MNRERPLLLEGGRRFLEAALARRPAWQVTGALPGEASVRTFFRVRTGRNTLVAMVYPQPAPAEIARVTGMARLLASHGLAVPETLEVIGDRIVLQEDAGDQLVQTAYRDGRPRRRRELLDAMADILINLRRIPAAATPARLDRGRMEWEMDFFADHFATRFFRPVVELPRLRRELRSLVGLIESPPVFAHRDFHSRNLLLKGRRIVLVDFQDALQAPAPYDLVSLAFDAYLDLGSGRQRLLERLALGGVEVDPRSYRLTALQRNLKALGTFGYQIETRGHRVYARYIPRTLRHVRGHFHALEEPALGWLKALFAGGPV